MNASIRLLSYNLQLQCIKEIKDPSTEFNSDILL